MMIILGSGMRRAWGSEFLQQCSEANMEFLRLYAIVMNMSSMNKGS